MLLAAWLVDLLAGFQPPLPVPLALNLAPDGNVLLFALVSVAGTGMVFGLLPALQASRADLSPALRNAEPAVASGRRRLNLRDALVVLQVAVSLVLLLGAALFARSLLAASAADPGFDDEGVLLVGLELDQQGYDTAKAQDFYRRLLERLQSLPGVESAALGETVPLTLRQQRRSVEVEGYEPQPGEEMEFDLNVVSPGYFHTLGIPLVRGRDFVAADRADAPAAVVVNEAFARRFWPGENPVGKGLDYGRGDGELARVVGVVGNVQLRRLGEAPRPVYYIPYTQEQEGDLILHVRSVRDPLYMVPAVRHEVRALDQKLPLIDPTTLAEATAVAVLPQRLGATLLGAFGGVAVLLAMVGLYGVLSYNVTQRTREVGIRIALGADPRQVSRMMMRRGLLLVGSGLVLGALLALATVGALRAFLFRVSPTDPTSLALTFALLTAVAAVASYLPARRATRVDPATVLRHE